MNNISIATIKNPEFIEVQSINPMISKCEIKVLYVGDNRNKSNITKEVATEMAKTLRGTPIVGYYKDLKEDFSDHGEQIVIDDEGLKISCLTKPYGFVATDSPIWFQEFKDIDKAGNETIREYLMCVGYLWDGQYPELRDVIQNGRPQSMELDETTLNGHWTKKENSNIEFFIINDAIFSKLCILGEDVEPCFEGASVTSPQISAGFTKDTKNFTRTLFTMMNELKELTYSLNKGGKQMEAENTNGVQTTEATVETIVPETQESQTEFQNSEGKNVEVNKGKNQKVVEEFKKTNEKENEEESSDDEREDESDDETKKKKPSKNSLEDKFSLLEQEFKTLQEKYSLLEKENKDLIKFKQQTEDREKDELIKSFYMLSDEDKKDVIENKSQYSLDDIESKLAVICVRKKVNFNLEEDSKQQPPITFNVSNTVEDSLPPYLKAVVARRENNN